MYRLMSCPWLYFLFVAAGGRGALLGACRTPGRHFVLRRGAKRILADARGRSVDENRLLLTYVFSPG